MKYSIIIVNYNTSGYVFECIQSIHEQTLNDSYEIIVVDNSDELLLSQAAGTTFQYIKSPGNIGFGRGCNLGADAAIGDILVFVNPDIKFHADVLAKLGSEIARHGPSTIIGVNLCDPHGQPTYSYGHFPGIKNAAAELLCLHKLAPKWFASCATALKMPSVTGQTVPVDYVCGALFAVGRATFSELAGFSKNIFLYFEETELLYRHRAGGGAVMLICDQLASHVGSVSTVDDSDFKILNMEAGRAVYYKTRYGLGPRLVVKALRVARLISLAVTKRRFCYVTALKYQLRG